MITPSPKIVIVGAGSLFFGRKLIWAMNRLEGLTGGTLSLVDTDPEHLEAMRQLAHRAREHSGATHAIEATTSVREALPGADFVLLSFSHRNAHYRGVDCTISEKYGVRMCSGDTIGPGGVFRALRELPNIIAVADAVAELCPNAWLINYVNPSTVLGMALQRHGKTRNFALCDSLHMPFIKDNMMKWIGLNPEERKDFSMVIAGVNHFTWMLEANFRGENLLPKLIAAANEAGKKEPADAPAKGLYNQRISGRLGELFGALPVCTAHTKEYLPYFQGYGPLVDQEVVPPLSIFEHESREAVTRDMWDSIARINRGEESIEGFFKSGASDHATDVIQAIWNNTGHTFYVNVPNHGAVANLPDDAVLELACRVDRQGPAPLPARPMPLGLRSLQHVILDTHELTVEAFFKKDRDLLIRALAVDPIVNSLAVAEAVTRDLYESQKDILEDWIAPRSTVSTDVSGVLKDADAVHSGQTKIF